MTHLPPYAVEDQLHDSLLKAYVPFVHSGKVRNTYRLGRKLLLQCATDRLSIFDFVLPTTVPGKGEILTALTVHWLNNVFYTFKHHLLTFGAEVHLYLPHPGFDNHDLQKRALVVKELEMAPVECIARGYLTGSGWSSYQKDGIVCGQHLPDDLFDGAKLPRSIFTPTTKEEEGHDEHINADSVDCKLSELTIKVYEKAADFALERGIILADTKLEFGVNGDLGDEVLTPDSSRFWDLEDWKKSSAKKKSPQSYDKEVVRTWGKTVETPWGEGIQNLDPTNAEHLAFVHSLEVPASVIEETSTRYYQIFKRLTGLTLSEFQRDVMRVTA